MQRNRTKLLRQLVYSQHLAPKTGWISAWVLALISISIQAEPQEPGVAQDQFVDLIHLSLEDLGKIKVTTVSRKSESLSTAAAAVYVITQDDIRRSGVTSLPEALRMAPGLDVARANSRQWAISSRGFNDTFANKLLVLMDGRTLYTPLFSGVFWDEADTLLEDVDRIEVIRGPGATQWGANAVNGVINIITKSAKETQGTLIAGGGGIGERGFASVRYGTQLATNAYLRVYAKYADHDEFTLVDGGGVGDNWWTAQGGFRLDWDASEINRVTLQGDYYHDDLGGKIMLKSLSPPSLVPTTVRFTAEGGNLLARWTHEFSSESEMSVQTYYDRTDRGLGIGQELRDTFDVDAQHRFHTGERNEIVWGAGYRFSVDQLSETPDLQVRNPNRGIQLFSAFVQDDVALVPDRLHLTLGTKLEHNDFTGFEFQPSGRLAWTPHEHHTVWASISRAVRTPTRSERDFRVFVDPGSLLPPLPLPTLVSVEGNPDLVSENLLAYEIGYRVQVHPRLSLDWTAFYNEYDHLRAITVFPFQLNLSPTPYLLAPTTLNNVLLGETYGTEVSALWQPIDSWRIRVNYTFLQMQMHNQDPTPSITEFEEKSSPDHQASLWSDLDLGHHVEWGIGLRFVDTLSMQRVPGYTELDTRLAWRPSRNCEFALVGRNLLEPHHREFAPNLLSYRRVEVDRAVYATMTFRF